jgi:hypothetical protein
MKSMAFLMDIESFIRSVWLRFGMNPPSRVFITSLGRLYIVIDDSDSIVRAMNKNGDIILVTNENLEIIDDNYYRMIRPDRFRYYGCGNIDNRDVVVKYMIYPLLFLRSK